MKFFFFSSNLKGQDKLFFEALLAGSVECEELKKEEYFSQLPPLVNNKIPYVGVIFYNQSQRHTIQKIHDNFPYLIFVEVGADSNIEKLKFAELVVYLSQDNAGWVESCAKYTFKSKDMNALIEEITDYLRDIVSGASLIAKEFIVTTKDYSFLDKSEHQTELILGKEHPGAFAFERKNHIHEGVDIYSSPNEAVYNTHEGVVLDIRPFTGEHTQKIGIMPSPWWNDTFCVLVKTKFGVINYGEIQPAAFLKIGQKVAKGDLLGHVSRVLKSDKGRPMDMVHLERYTMDALAPVVEWRKGEEKPAQLLPPANLLLGLCIKKD